MSTANLNSRLNSKIKTTQTESESPKTTENYIALTNNALEIISENLKNQPLTHQMFDIIKSPSGGITSFSVPSISGDNMEKEISGIILNYTTPRAYWDTPDPIEGTPPVCWSNNSQISHEGKACEHCPYNDYGSKNGGETAAKACKESVQILLLRPDNIMPVIIRVPVSSKLIFKKYMIRLVGKMIPLTSVVTRITLTKATSKEGKPYALYNFEMVNTLSSEEANSAKMFGQKFTEILNVASEPIELKEENNG